MIRVGCAYRAGLLPHIWEHLDEFEVWEHTIDGYVSAGADGLAAIRRMAAVGPLTVHSLDLSIGSPAARSRPLHLREVRAVMDAAGVDTVSDHIGYSRVDERRLHDFMPLWRVEEQLALAVANIDFLQDRLGCRLVLENVASLFDPGGEIGHAEFSNELVRRTGCALLLDISNMLLNERNGHLDAAAEFDVLDLDAVVGIHLAGGVQDEHGLWWDAHQVPVPDDDLIWLARLLPRMPNVTEVIVERDDALQRGADVVDDVRRIKAIVATTATTVA